MKAYDITKLTAELKSSVKAQHITPIDIYSTRNSPEDEYVRESVV